VGCRAAPAASRTSSRRRAPPYLGWHGFFERLEKLTFAEARTILLGNTAVPEEAHCCPKCGVALGS
jgi:hypothetical protein